MKSYFLSILFACSIVTLQAQTISDITDLSTTNLLGTARYMGLSGAFGALGGDISALNANPAGSAVFTHSAFTFSAAAYYTDNQASWFNGVAQKSNSDFQINQAGAVMVFNNTNQKGAFRKVSVGFNYDLNNNFDDRIFVLGRGNESVTDYFVNNANGFFPDELSLLPGESLADAYIDIGNVFGFNAQQGFLGYQAFVIDPADPTGSTYVSNASIAGGVEQEFMVNTRGTDSKFTFNLATQYKDFLYLGFNLNLFDINKRRYFRTDEFGYAPDSFVQSVQFENEIFTFGTGISADFGFIAKVGKSLRLGATYQTPTRYDLVDELWQGVNSVILDSGSNTTELIEVYPDVIYRFPDYSIVLPAKYTLSSALILGDNALISLDYSFQDMGNAKFKPSNDPYFSDQNTLIGQSLDVVNTVRLGGEYRLGRWSMRGGYAYQDSPYSNGSTIGSMESFSLGGGLDIGGSRFDLAWSYGERNNNPSMYPLNNSAFIRTNTSNWVFSYTLKF